MSLTWTAARWVKSCRWGDNLMAPAAPLKRQAVSIPVTTKNVPALPRVSRSNVALLRGLQAADNQVSVA